MTRASPFALAILCCVLARMSGAQQPPALRSAASNDSTRMAVVTYISGQSVYVGAGRADGVAEGTSLEVLRNKVVIATVRATFLSSHSSSGEIVSSTAAPIVGDSVRYHPAIEQSVVATPDTIQHESESRPRRPSWQRPVRGHVGLRYLSISQPNLPGATTLTQPSADVHLEGTNVGGSSLGFVIDGRSRHTIGARDAQTSALDQRTLVYEASVSATHQRSGARLSVGRQYSPALASVSLFDGVTAELNRPRWGLGLFGGMQPDVSTMAYSTAIRESGGYVQVHNAPDQTLPWSVTTGAVSSSDIGEINREFGFAQVSVSSRVVSFYATQEVDVNRGWKRAAGEPAVSPTSTFGFVSIRPNDVLSLQGGFDNRRNVRLYRDFVSPETQFDDAFREGVWGGADLTIHQRIRIGGNARMSRGGTTGSADYYTGSLGVGPLSRLGFEARARSTSFRTDRAAGWLNAWSAAVDPLGLVQLEINGGLRTQRSVSPVSAGSPSPVSTMPNVHWIGANVDVNLGRSWYALLSGTRDGSGADLTNQIYGGLVWRF